MEDHQIFEMINNRRVLLVHLQCDASRSTSIYDIIHYVRRQPNMLHLVFYHPINIEVCTCAKYSFFMFDHKAHDWVCPIHYPASFIPQTLDCIDKLDSNAIAVLEMKNPRNSDNYIYYKNILEAAAKRHYFIIEASSLMVNYGFRSSVVFAPAGSGKSTFIRKHKPIGVLDGDDVLIKEFAEAGTSWWKSKSKQEIETYQIKFWTKMLETAKKQNVCILTGVGIPESLEFQAIWCGMIYFYDVGMHQIARNAKSSENDPFRTFQPKGNSIIAGYIKAKEKYADFDCVTNGEDDFDSIVAYECPMEMNFLRQKFDFHLIRNVNALFGFIYSKSSERTCN